MLLFEERETPSGRDSCSWNNCVSAGNHFLHNLHINYSDNRTNVLCKTLDKPEMNCLVNHSIPIDIGRLTHLLSFNNHTNLPFAALHKAKNDGERRKKKI